MLYYILYDNENGLIKSIKNLNKNKNCFIQDIYSPYPIHEVNHLLNLCETNLSILSFVYGFLGFLFSSLLIWYTMIFDWPQNIGGKPSYSWIRNFPSFIPVIFELIIFFSAHFMCITYLIQCNLYPGRTQKNPDPRTTDDMFLIKIYIKNDIEYIINLLKKNGAKEIKLIKK
ncbi:DUF3341 domain-containing protein [Blattabacterium cuenoti]|uniref:DUF3341 domain-containing protein n=1 Tax=Blattabacterium cuenoti TaxID=1653831 RepID=UPI00163CBAAC|nr:DUF3341 domain-containing protein [Blattabacterium cuenoti]